MHQTGAVNSALLTGMVVQQVGLRSGQERHHMTISGASPMEKEVVAQLVLHQECSGANPMEVEARVHTVLIQEAAVTI